MKTTFKHSMFSPERALLLIIDVQGQLARRMFNTCADLMNLHYAVEVVADAVSSRQERDKQVALERIKSLGGMVTTTAMIVCELLKTSQHKKFREIINLIK